MVALTKSPTDVNVAWRAIPGRDGLLSSQGLAISCPANNILFHGPRGNGKTAAQLMAFRKNVGRGYGRYHRGLILDLETKDLDDIVNQSEELFGLFDDGARFNRSKGDYRWIWPSGEQLLFRTAKDERDYKQFHGHSYSFLGFNEITKHATRDLYDIMGSVNRTGFLPEMTPKIKVKGKYVYNTPDGLPLPPITLTKFLTTNPNGPGHNWVQEEWIDASAPGELIYTTQTIYDPWKDETREVTVSQVHFFGNFYENPFISDVYRLDMERVCARNENLRQAWIFGNWNISAGGALDDLWNDNVHVINRFKIPENWVVDRSMDWGSVHPYGVIWWAEANGEEVEMLDGTYWAPPAGTLFAICEEYSGENSNSNRGNKRSATKVAQDILDQEEFLRKAKWINSEVQPGPADNDIRGTRASEQKSPETLMQAVGVTWKSSDKGKNSRKLGLMAFRERLEASLDREGPGIYFMRNCANSIKTIRSIPRDPDNIEDVNTKAVDHLYDTARYKIYEVENRPAQNLVVRQAN